MANNYFLFSALLPFTKPEQQAWATTELGRLDDEGFAEEGECTFEITPEGVYFYSMESGNLESVIPFVQDFLKKFDPKGFWACEYAVTCSKPRPGEFGGGAVFVTATGEEWLSSGRWVVQKEAEHQKANKPKKKAKKKA